MAFAPRASPTMLDVNIHRSELKAHIDPMALRSDEIVDHNPVSRVDERHATAMGDGRIRFVLTDRFDDGFVRAPPREPSATAVLPCKWPCRLRLRFAIDHDRAVGRCSAEEIAKLRVCRVAARTGIYEERLTRYGALNAQKIRVSMAAAEVAAERASVEDHRVCIAFPSAPHDCEAAALENPR